MVGADWRGLAANSGLAHPARGEEGPDVGAVPSRSDNDPE